MDQNPFYLPSYQQAPVQPIQQPILQPQIRVRQFDQIRPQNQQAPYQQQPTVNSKADERAIERVSHILKTLPKNVKINTVLDIGAGNAEITDKIAKTLNASNAYAMDVYKSTEFKKPFPNSIVQYFQIENESLPFSTSSIDLVSMFMSIHHIQNTVKLFAEICRVLKPNGFFFFREHNVTNDQMRIYLDEHHKKWEQDPLKHSIDPTYYWSRQNLFDHLNHMGFQHIADSDYTDKNPQAVYHSMYQNKNCKIKNVYLSEKSEDWQYIEESFIQVNPNTRFVPTWEDANVMWKPTSSRMTPSALPKLYYFNNLFTSNTSLTEKGSLLKTGTTIFGLGPTGIFSILPYSFEYNPNVSLDTYLPQNFETGLLGLGDTMWITKPTAGFSGKGIQIFNNRNALLQSLHPNKKVIIQKYIENPLLINGYKFDIRMYVLITGNRILSHPDGYGRVAPLPYSHNDLDLTRHLTNIDLHKNGDKPVTVLTLDQLQDIGIKKDTLYAFINQLRPLFEYALRVEQEYKATNNIKFETFELFGVDMMFDATGHPWLLEINKNPGTLTNTPSIIPDVLKETLLNQPTQFMLLEKEREPFPYKREFLNPEELWNNARQYDLAQVQLIDIPVNSNRWRSIPPNFQWQLNGQPVGIVVSNSAYDAVDKLVDYFSEDPRMQARRKDCISSYDFYNSNYSQVVTKAQELQSSSGVNPELRYRHWLREALYMLNKECTTFKISVTKALFKHLGSRKVLDPSAGWGDRLLGAAAAGIELYHGVDPNPQLRKSYDEMLEFIRNHGVGQNYFVLTEDFLQVNFGNNFYDTVFTSPPFFDYEIYSQDEKQSITGRSTLQEWTQGFLYPYLSKAWGQLLVGGYFAIYISDTRSGKYVENMFNFINQNLGGKFLGIIAVADEKLSHAFPIWLWQRQM